MKPDLEILDRNLELLLRRSWERVSAREEFRARLEREFVAAAALRRRSAVRRSRPSPLVRVALAASLAVCAYLAWSTLSREGPLAPLDASEIVARGEVAWRARRGGEWSAHPAGVDELPLQFAAEFLEVVTPAGGPTRVTGVAEQPWSVFPGSHVELALESAGLAARLECGGVVARGPARVSTSEGEVRVVSGGVRVAFEQPDEREVHALALAVAPDAHWVRVSARGGAAQVRGRLRGEFALERAAEGWLADGLAALAPSEESGSGREPVGAGEAEEPEPPLALDGVHGVVRAADRPLERFRVVALRQVNLPQRAEPVRREFVDPSGRYHFEGLEPAPYRFYVIAEGYAVAKSEVLQVLEGSGIVLDFALEQGVTLGGSVLDAQSGAPISGAYIVSESDTQIAVLSLDPEDNLGFDRATSSLGNGSFRFERLARGAQVLRASAPGYGAAWLEELRLEPGEQRLELVFRLPRVGRIEGSVLDAAGLPVPEVMVIASTTDFERKRPCLTYRRVVGGADGGFVVPDLGPGAWAVLNFGPTEKLRDGQYTPEFALAAVRVGAPTVVNFHAKRPKQVLHGFVRDAAGQALAHLGLMVAPQGSGDPTPGKGWSSGITLEDGSYRIPDLEPGSYDLYVSRRGPTEMVYVESFTVRAGPEQQQDFELGVASLSGRVLDGARERGMDLAVLVLYTLEPGGGKRFSGKVLSDSEGRYVIAPLRAGRYEVWAYSSSEVYGQEWSAIEVAEGQVSGSCDFTLRPGGRLLARVLDADGQPVSDAEVRFFDRAGNEAQFAESIRTDAQGVYVVAGVKPGRWRVRAALSDGRSAEVEAEVAVGERAEAELRLPRR